MTGYFGLTVIIDENISRPNISHLFPSTMKNIRSLEKSKSQIPQLWILKILLLRTTIVYFLLQKEGIMIIADLYLANITVQNPFEPHIWVPLNSEERGKNKESQAINFL